MKKILIYLIVCMLCMVTVVSHAATYTLPEKMQNQLTIGSGLKGEFRITAEGDLAKTPFLNAVTDADFYLRGMKSENDLHYYIFQQDEEEHQSALSELYRKDGVCYFRSDLVQGKVLAFPSVAQYMDTLFPVTGENPTVSSALLKILTLSDADKNDKWKPIISRYQNELEMWLADFTVQADVVKLDDGSSALDFTYSIPVDKFKEQTLQLFTAMVADSEVSSLLDQLMTPEQKAVYANANLADYYREALASLDLSQDILMSKRVSALGDVKSSLLSLPLDPGVTGYAQLTVEGMGNSTRYELSGEEQTVVLVVPSDGEQQQEYDKTFWLAVIKSEQKEESKSFAVRLDLRKTYKEYTDDEDRTHETTHYSLTVTKDTAYLPENVDPAVLEDTITIQAELDLHYHSKYSQNSATTLEINGSFRQGESAVSVVAKVKTAAPWLFMPFEVVDPIAVDAADPAPLLSYITDWISNSASMIHHSMPAEEPTAEPSATEQPTPEPTETEEPASESTETEEPADEPAEA